MQCFVLFSGKNYFMIDRHGTTRKTQNISQYFFFIFRCQQDAKQQNKHYCYFKFYLFSVQQNICHICGLKAKKIEMVNIEMDVLIFKIIAATIWCMDGLLIIMSNREKVCHWLPTASNAICSYYLTITKISMTFLVFRHIPLNFKKYEKRHLQEMWKIWIIKPTT